MKKGFLLSIAIITLFSCGRQMYETSDYDRLAQSHQVLAVLPAELITTGRIPKELTDEDILAIENSESKAFQISLYHQLARISGYRLNINFQHYNETNSRLKAAGISIRDSWQMSPKKLADALGVDAVVHSTVEKEFYLTNLESFGVHVGTAILGIFTKNSFYHLGSNRTSDVLVSCEIIDGEEGLPIWASHSNSPTYWNRPHREVVDQLTRRMCRRFPYRN